MEQFRKKIKSRMLWLSALSLITALFGVYDVFFASDTLRNMEAFEFQGGALAALCLLSSLNIMRYNKILRDDTKLKMECNKENDERFKAIRSKAGLPNVMVLSILMIIAGIIAGYFNVTVFYTLIIAAICQILISGFIKLIFMRKM